jgi:CheY-like chemotaxis protein
MVSILLVEDGAGVGRELTSLLEAAGHRVLRCGGGPTPLGACLLLRRRRCPLPDSAELLIFACTLNLPLPGRSYRGIHLLRAYRAHPDYGRLPLVLAAVAPPQDLEGPGPTEVVETFADPARVLAAVNRLLRSPGRPPIPPAAEHHDMRRAAAGLAGALLQPPETDGVSLSLWKLLGQLQPCSP